MGATASARFVPAELLVIRAPGDGLDPRPGGDLAARDPRAAAALARHGLNRWRAGRSGRRGDSASIAWLTLTSARPDFDPVAAARELSATGAVLAAAPNLLLHLYVLPDDPDLSLEYWVDAPGNPDVQLAQAWDVTRGDTSIAIGVMDTGVDRTHPDLAAQIWRNWGEIPGNAIDDDGDGYIDDINGWDFGDGDDDPNPGPVFDPIGIDVGFHGTFVAALASAATDNAEGIAGAGWRCRILPLKVTNEAGEITLEATTAAFRYAWAHHVNLLNMSLGTPDTTARAFFQALVDSATDAGVLCVAAAGNDGASDPSFPAACNHVLAVAATDEFNQRASFSNFGAWVDLAAPGASMWSAICRNYVIDDFSQIWYLYFFGWDGERPYMYGDGTSFACPIASGACALVLSRWPYLSPERSIQHAILTGDAVAYDEPIGPKLNAFRAVTEEVLAVPRPARAAATRAWPNPFLTSTSVSFTVARGGPGRVDVFDTAGRHVRTLVHGALGRGDHEARWDGRLESGAAARAGLYFVRIETPDGGGTLRVVRIE